MHPRLKFKIDYKKDINTFYSFNNEADFDNGRNLEWAVLNKYPQFKKYRKEYKLDILKEKIEKFVKSVYSKNEKTIYKNMFLCQKRWEKSERDYFLLVDDLFSQWPWPKGKYIAYPTIWGMYPRFLEDKTFQVPYESKKATSINVIIAHEMLHFIFYDYFYKKYPKYKSNKHAFFVWNISEIFNSVIQNHPKWAKKFKTQSIPYPEHKKIVALLEKKFHKNNAIQAGELIEEIIKNLELP